MVEQQNGISRYTNWRICALGHCRNCGVGVHHPLCLEGNVLEIVAGMVSGRRGTSFGVWRSDRSVETASSIKIKKLNSGYRKSGRQSESMEVLQYIGLNVLLPMWIGVGFCWIMLYLHDRDDPPQCYDHWLFPLLAFICALWISVVFLIFLALTWLWVSYVHA